MIPEGLIRVRRMPAAGSLAPISVSSGPGPSFPFSPSLWQPRQPWPATASLPSSYCAGTSISIVVGEPASAPRKVRYAIAMMVMIPAIVATGRLRGSRSGLRS